MEIFITLGKAGTYENLLLDTIARLISKNLRNHVPIIDIISLLKEVKEDKFYFRLQENQEIPHSADSIIDAIGIIMEEYFQDDLQSFNQNLLNKQKSIDSDMTQVVSSDNILDLMVKDEKVKMKKCPECGNYTLDIYSGCKGGSCTYCGYSNCS